MQLPDWSHLGFPQYLAIGGGIVVVLAILLYLIPGARFKVPAIVVSTLASLAVGIGLGMMIMATLGYYIERQQPGARASGEEGAQAGMPPGGAMKGSGMMKMGGKTGGGGPMMGMMGGGGGGGARSQLASLVAKLDTLTGKPLAVNLSQEQKKKVCEQLQGLAGPDSISEEDAKKKLDLLLDLLKSDKETLKAAGFRWPGELVDNRDPRQPLPPNPFKDAANNKHLKTLEDRLAKGPAK